MNSRDGDGRAEETRRVFELDAWQRCASGVVGGAAGVAGATATFETTNQAGAVALIAVGALGLLVALTGWVPERIGRTDIVGERMHGAAAVAAIPVAGSRGIDELRANAPQPSVAVHHPHPPAPAVAERPRAVAADETAIAPLRSPVPAPPSSGDDDVPSDERPASAIGVDEPAKPAEDLAARSVGFRFEVLDRLRSFPPPSGSEFVMGYRLSNGPLPRTFDAVLKSPLSEKLSDLVVIETISDLTRTEVAKRVDELRARGFGGVLVVIPRRKRPVKVKVPNVRVVEFGEHTFDRYVHTAEELLHLGDALVGLWSEMFERRLTRSVDAS